MRNLWLPRHSPGVCGRCILAGRAVALAIIVVHEQRGLALDAPVATLCGVPDTAVIVDVAPSWAVGLLQQLAAGREGACNRAKEGKGKNENRDEESRSGAAGRDLGCCGTVAGHSTTA